ncbi:amidohydrolase family protein [Fundidesulfovibrio terrae]|uniref:amidohydrolase family protein n=1 Tax=Fundidesulfovibrio terrae TaxID=2922866 RepID=UPI001FAED61B|nr:amidohydrolase family protein [Fundidesulfovibrio terrae]
MTNDETYTLRVRRAAIMFPGREIVEDAAVVVHDGLVVQAGAWSDLKASCPADVRDLGETTLLPGLVNAHGHLELSHLGLPPARMGGYLDWVRWLVAQPLGGTNPEAVARAAMQLLECGTAAVADIATRLPRLVAQGLDEAGIDYAIFFERFGYQGDAPLPDIDSERLALAGHALYSTSPESLRAAKAWDTARGKPFSIHLAEHEGETELLAAGTGAFADFMRERILPKDFIAPGLSPVAWADALGLLDSRTLAVHAVHVSKSDIEILKGRGATVCLCPRSNEIIGVGRAPARALLDAGVPCCLGTDSLASAPDLNLFEELSALLAFCPLSPHEALSLLGPVPARALGFHRLGRLAPGSPARFAVLPTDLEAALFD